MEEAVPSNDAPVNDTANLMSPDAPLSWMAEFENYDWSSFLVVSSFYGNYDETETGVITADPLNHPLL